MMENYFHLHSMRFYPSHETKATFGTLFKRSVLTVSKLRHHPRTFLPRKIRKAEIESKA